MRSIGVGRPGGGGDGGGGGQPPPNNLRGGGGATYLLPPSPNNPPIFSFNFYVKQEKNHKCTKLKGKILKNVTLIRFEGTCKTILFNSILEYSALSDFQVEICNYLGLI